jgi:hypothetical protein
MNTLSITGLIYQIIYITDFLYRLMGINEGSLTNELFFLKKGLIDLIKIFKENFFKHSFFLI